jgi:cell division protein FtsB
MKVLTGLGFLLLMGVIGLQMYRLNDQRSALARELQELRRETEAVRVENESVRVDIDYYADPRNLVKAARDLLNVKRPGERLYIPVPE